MKYFFSISLFLVFITLIISISLLLNFEKKKDNYISAYYNSSGSFAGFIQKKNKLIRACEFSTNGNVLSCSKWFNEDTLKQGRNKGLTLEDI